MSPSRLEPPGAVVPDPDPIQIHALDVLGDRLERAASASIARTHRSRRAPWAWGLTLAPALALLAAVVLFSSQLAPAADARVIRAADRTASRSTGRFVMTTTIATAGAATPGSTVAGTGAAPADLRLQVDGTYDRASGRLRTTIDLDRLLGGRLGGAGTPGGPALGGVVETIQDGSTLYLRADVFTRALPGHPTWVSVDLDRLGSGGSGGPAAGAIAEILGGAGGGTVVADPADLLDALRGIGPDTVAVDRTDLDGVATTHYRGTVRLAAAAAAQSPAEAARLRDGFAHLGLDAADAQLPMDVWVDGDGDVRRVQTTLDLSQARNRDGSSMGAGPTVVTTDYQDLGGPAAIAVPTGAVVDITAMVQGALAGPIGGSPPTTGPR